MSPVPAPDPVSDAATAESLGLGKYVAVGFNGLPTWIDPAAADWADVVANNYGWWQVTANGTEGEWDLYLGRGDGTTPFAAVSVGATYATFNLSDSGSDGLVSALLNAVTAQVQVTPVAGQTEAMAALGTVMAIAPDGSVGAVTPNVGDVIKWDGTKWIADAP